VLGLLPDDAEQPAVVRRDGTREALIVTGNVYVIELPVRPITQQPARVEWTRHGPSDGIDVPIPADVASGWPDGVPAGRPNWWDWAAGTTPTDLLRIEGQSAAAPSHGKEQRAAGRTWRAKRKTWRG
jgi:hypothetical protein